MRIFVSGGAKNGKSALAEDLAVVQKKDAGRLLYIATLKPADGEDEERIAKHRLSRKDKSFETLELPLSLGRLLPTLAVAEDSLLLDSLTAVLGNEMFMTEKGYLPQVGIPLKEELQKIVTTFPNLVVVSDYIYSSSQSYDEVTTNYRKTLGELDCYTAGLCDIVLEVSYGHVICHKGKELYHELSQRLFGLPWYV